MISYNLQYFGGRGASGISGKAGSVPTGSFSELSVSDKRLRLEAYKKSLEDRFKSYEIEGYSVFKVGSKYTAHDFNISDKTLKKWNNESYSRVAINNTLNGIKDELRKSRAAQKALKK